MKSAKSYQTNMDLALNIIPRPIPDICESAHERLSLPIEKTENRPSTGKRVSFSQRRSPTLQIPSLPPTPSSRPSIRSKTSIARAHTSLPKKLETCAKKERMPTIPSTSTLSSHATGNSARCELRVFPTAPIQQKHQMSEHAAETVRVMDWAISLVKAAEKRVKQEERAKHEKEVIDLKLRIREAEKKIREMDENPKEEGASDEASPVDARMGPRMFWKLDRSEMGRLESLIRHAHRECRAGLAVVLEG